MSRWVVVEFVGGPKDGERRVEGWPLGFEFVEVPRSLRAVALFLVRVALVTGLLLWVMERWPWGYDSTRWVQGEDALRLLVVLGAAVVIVVQAF